MISEHVRKKAFDAVEIIREYEPEDGYYLAFSGGKDSIVCYDLLDKSGVSFDAHYSFTSVDPPELISFIKNEYPGVEWIRPEKTMYQLIEKNNGFPPTRRCRYCCSVLKEGGGVGRTVVTGIRSQESRNRSKRSKIEDSTIYKNKRFLHIIFDWSENDVWEYIRGIGLKYCSLYDDGLRRVGCIGCPMNRGHNRLFDRYPKHKDAYIRSIHRGLLKRPSKHFGTDANMLFDWWTSNMSIRDFMLKYNKEKNHE